MSSGTSSPTARVSSGPVVPSLPPPHVRPRPLSEIVATVPGSRIDGDGATAVLDVAFDSRDVPRGSLFFCIPGRSFDGHDFARAALASGAAAVVVQRRLEGVDAPQVIVPSVRDAMGPMSAAVFGSPAASMRTVAVTGTNGKTTTTFLLESIFRAAGSRGAAVGTTGVRLDGDAIPMARTTPEAPELHRLLGSLLGAGVDAVAVEVSSHALDQHRVDGIVFDVAGFTNLSQDHLDHHGSMESYFDAKQRLFDPRHAVVGVVGVDDAWGRRLAEHGSIPITTYALDAAADVLATDVRVGPLGSSFRLDGLEIRTRLLGRFNVVNALGAATIARTIGIDPSAVAAGIAAVEHVPGRFEPVDAGQKFLVVVDYAHTPDSIQSVLQASRPLASGRLIVVFGCGGDRDRAKRPRMGKVATELADLTVVTTDNPRSEDPAGIIAQIETGAHEGGGAFVVEPDRRAAIRLAVAEAREGDVVVIAGKGHESYQEVAGRVVPFDDRQVADEALRAPGAGS